MLSKGWQVVAMYRLHWSREEEEEEEEGWAFFKELKKYLMYSIKSCTCISVLYYY